jgi:UDP-N-acetylmuramoylalanine--D-glutamate ligase
VRVGVWGHGREGHGAVRAALTAGAAGVHVVDSRPVDAAELPDGVTASAAVADLAGCDLVVRSPGISPYRTEARELAERTCVTTGTGIALAEFARRGVPTLCVTGTKGKSTTSALAAAALEAAGRPAVHAGNIGTPLLDVLLDGTTEGRTLVVEISSYQAAAVPDFAGLGALTSLAPEHLDWHGDVATYYRDKLRVFASCPPGSVVVAPQARALAERFLDPVQLVDPDDVVPAALAAALRPQHLLGEHNLGNVRVALAACALLGLDLGASADRVLGAVGTFQALPHRLSPIARHGEVTVVDDTLSTTPVSVLAALDALAPRPVTLIAGGQDRGLDYWGLAAGLVARWAATAIGTAVPGGVVLLSPGAPSYNRFRNYEELAARFTELVLAAGATALPGVAR